MLNLDFEAQGCGSTFTLCHDHLKKAISLGKSGFSDLFFPPLYIINCKATRLDSCSDCTKGFVAPQKNRVRENFNAVLVSQKTTLERNPHYRRTAL